MRLDIRNSLEWITSAIAKRRVLFLFLAAMVVFITTYLLVLPAMTLDTGEAARQGGIDVQALAFDGEGYSVEATFDAKAGLPPDTQLSVSEITKEDEDYKAWEDEALKTVQSAEDGEAVKELQFARFYDISLQSGGKEVEPKAPVSITISYDKAPKAADADHVRVVHFAAGKEAEMVNPEETNAMISKGRMEQAQFEADSFSVYGVVYTVDFHWDADGKTYDYSMEGEGSILLSELFERLSIPVAATDVSDVTFSDPKLLKVSREGEDWILQSLQPFDTEESLAVTLVDGQSFVIRVTDAADPSIYIGKEVIIYYDGRAMTSEWENGNNRTDFISVPEQSADSIESARWTIEYDQSRQAYYLKSHDGKYLQIDHKNVYLVNNQWEATPLRIQPGGSPDYWICAKDNNDNVLTYCDNNEFDGFFCAPEGANNPGSKTRRWIFIREYSPQTPRKNRLVYLDEEASEITIGVGDTLTLRPYGEWYWKNDDQPADLKSKVWSFDDNSWNATGLKTDYKSDSGKNYSTSYRESAAAKNGTVEFKGYSKWDDQLKEFYTVYHGTAKQTGDFTLTNTAGRTITVHVVNSVSEPPQTVKKTANIAVNLFDYDKGGALDPSDNTNVVGNLKGDTVNNNKYGNLKFLSSGSGSQGSAINQYNYDNSNSGILNPNLPKEGKDKGYPCLSTGNGGASLKYLFDTRNTSWGTYDKNSDSWSSGSDMIAYPNVEGLFQQDTDGFYYFNSNSNYAYYDGNRMVLYDYTYTQKTQKTLDENAKPIGFFPFHQFDSTKDLTVNQNSNLNHHLGMSMDLDFEIPKDRQNNGKDIVYEFSGDDDMWVFIDDELVLDIGGIHQPVRGKIDFTHGKIYVYGRNEVTKEFKVGEHNMKVFYLERGGCDSNCSIRFNLPTFKTLDLSKRLQGLTAEELAKYKNEEFTYELKLNGQLYNSPEGADQKQALQAQRIGADGKVKEYFLVHNGQIKIKPGETVRIPHLSGTDTFYVAEEKSLNMEQFEAPHAERDYYLVSDGEEHEEEVPLSVSHTEGASSQFSDWKTPDYSVNETEKVTFTNSLKEKNLEVEKIWKDQKDHSADEVKFTVRATVPGEDDKEVAYTVTNLKDGNKDKEFTLNAGNHWKTIIQDLPILSPDGKFITYHVTEKKIPGYVSHVKDVTESETRCNVDVMKLWPDDAEHTEKIYFRLKNSAGKYYAGEKEDGTANFTDNGKVFVLSSENGYTQRISHVPKDGTYTVEEVGDQDKTTTGLVAMKRTIVDFDIENEPIGEQVDPSGSEGNPQIHKRIDALRDGTKNPDSAHEGEDLTDLYRLYLDYKVDSVQEPNGVDLLFVIDHSGSMNNEDWQGNVHRAPSVMEALNGEHGVIAEFLAMNEKNRWAAVGFKGPNGTEYRGALWDEAWRPSYFMNNSNAGQRDSEILSPAGNAFSRNNTGVSLPDEGANRLTNYTAGLWRAEQFLLQDNVKNDGRKKAVIFISDGMPTLHIDCPGGTLANAGVTDGSYYYPDWFGGCPGPTLEEVGYFADDMRKAGYEFGGNMEFYTIGFGGSMQTETGSALLRNMLDTVYGQTAHDGHFMTITDIDPEGDYNSSAAEKLKDDLRIITGLKENFTNIRIQDDLSKYVDLVGLAPGKTGDELLQAAKAKVTMSDPSDPSKAITLYENGALTSANRTEDGKPILSRVTYDSSTKTVTAIFDKDYEARPGVTYTLSFDVKATEEAYSQYAKAGYDKDKDGHVIQGDEDTDFLGTTPPNATSVDKDGFRSNDEAKTTYDHNGKPGEKEYPHPVIQVSLPIVVEKTDQTGAALEGATFKLYGTEYEPAKSDAENASALIAGPLTSKKDKNGKAVIFQGGLQPGTYYLVEVSAPAGYLSLDGPVRLEIAEAQGGQGGMTLTAFIGEKQIDASKLTRDNKTGQWDLKLANSAGYELPSSGGHGTTWMYLLGTILLLGSTILLTARRRVFKV